MLLDKENLHGIYDSTTPWTPSQISPTIWLDASDFRTITLSASPQPFSGLVCFGDSWTENRSWPQVVCNTLNIPFSAANNYAKSGARALPSTGTNNLSAQMRSALNAQTNVLNPNFLYALTIGGNDLLAAVAPLSVIAEIKTRTQDMINAGARWFLMNSQNDFARYLSPSYASKRSLFVEFGVRQQTMISELQFANPTVSFIQWSSGDFLQAAAADPTSFNTTASADNPTGLMSSDGLHMVANGYNQMGRWIASAITRNVRGTISQWNDKSSNSNHVYQSSSVRQPIYVVQGAVQGNIAGAQRCNNLPCIRFDGSNDQMQTLTGLGARTGVTAFIVAKLRQSITGFRNILAGEWRNNQLNSGQNSWVLAAGVTSTGTNPNVQIEIGNPSAQKQPSITSSSSVLNQYYMLGMTHDGTTLTGRMNGTTFGTMLTAGTINNISGLPFIVADIDGYASESPVDICEIVAMLRPPATNEVERIEGYLAWKWGLVANLPAGHTFKTSPPYL